MTRAPSPRPPAPEDQLDGEPERSPDLGSGAPPAPKPRKPRKPRSSEARPKAADSAAGKPRKARTKRESTIAPASHGEGSGSKPRTRKSAAPRKKKESVSVADVTPAVHEGHAEPFAATPPAPVVSGTGGVQSPEAPLSAAATTPRETREEHRPLDDYRYLSPPRWGGATFDRFANPAAPPERMRSPVSVVRTQAVIVRDTVRADSPALPTAELAQAEPALLSALALEAAPEPEAPRELEVPLEPRPELPDGTDAPLGVEALDGASQDAEPAPTESAPPSVAPEPVLTPTLVESMPYHPSAPCATCATGVDPLRAAALRATDKGIEYFCSRRCRDAQEREERERAERELAERVQAERELAERVQAERARAELAQAELAQADLAQAERARAEREAGRAHVERVQAERAQVERVPSSQAPRPRPAAAGSVKRAPAASVQASRPPPKSLQPVASRIVPSHATTPVWPWLVTSIACSLPVLRQPYATTVAAGLLMCTAALFTGRSRASREQAGMVGWLAPALAVVALSLAAVLADAAQAQLWIFTASVALLGSWAREHWLERSHALLVAMRADLDARTAARVRVVSQDGLVTERALNSVRVGDRVWIEPGSVVPVDGVLEEGDTELLPYPQARLTVRRSVGGAVLGGALIVGGAVKVRATAVGSKRALLRALATPDRALESASSTARRAMRVRALAPGVLALGTAALAAALAPETLSTKLAGLGAALSVLPMLAASRGLLNTLQRALIRGAARGLFFRDGAALERAGQIDTALMRIEGTLAPRSYSLVEVRPLSADISAEAMVAWALGAEATSEGHPIALALRRHAALFGIEPALVRRLAYTRGAGVSGLTDGHGALVLGSRAALLQAGVSVAVADRDAQQAEQNGHKVVLLALGGHVRGLFVFAQELRGEARLAVQSLFDLGLEVELLSGDHRSTVEAMARTLDVLQLKAELTRDQRDAELKRLRDGEARVAVLGSATDAGSLLSAADLGICLEGAPEVHAPGDLRAISYDVITASSDLRDGAHALAIAREARRGVVQVWALAGVGGLLAGLAALSLVPAWASVMAGLAIDACCLHPRTLRGRAAQD